MLKYCFLFGKYWNKRPELKKIAIPFHSDFAFSCRPIVSPESYPIPKFVCTPCMHRIPSPWQGKPLQLTLSIFFVDTIFLSPSGTSCQQSRVCLVWSFFWSTQFFMFLGHVSNRYILPFLKKACGRFTFWAIFYVLAVSSVRWILKQKGNYWALPRGSTHVWALIEKWRH